MPASWYVVMTILGIILFISSILILKACIRDYKIMRKLTSDVHPESNIPRDIPITTGRRVYYMNENIHVIDLRNINVIDDLQNSNVIYV